MNHFNEHDPIERAIQQIKNGGMVVVLDDEDRENEGDLIIGAEKITSEAITFMARQACGLICLALTGDQVDKLQLPLMSLDSEDNFQTAFTVSIDAALGITTGISAADRALTIQLASNPNAILQHLKKPGHIFPLRAKNGGVLERPGHTEAAVDLARLAGLWPAGVICEIMGKNGTMMRKKQLQKFAKRHRLPIITIEDLISYRKKQCNNQPKTESNGFDELPNNCASDELQNNCADDKLPNNWLVKTAETTLPTAYGKFKMQVYLERKTNKEHVALIFANMHSEKVKGKKPIIRIHSECLTGDSFFSLKCDCGPQLKDSLKKISKAGNGVLLYLRQEGRGIGLTNKIRCYALQEKGLDTTEANLSIGEPIDNRSYEVAIAILQTLNIKSFNLLTNNPKKLEALRTIWGTKVVRSPSVTEVNTFNKNYLACKKAKMGHLL